MSNFNIYPADLPKSKNKGGFDYNKTFNTSHNCVISTKTCISTSFSGHKVTQSICLQTLKLKVALAVLVVQALNNILLKHYSSINFELNMDRIISDFCWYGEGECGVASWYRFSVGQYKDLGHEKRQNHISSQWERAVYHRGSLLSNKDAPAHSKSFHMRARPTKETYQATQAKQKHNLNGCL